MRPFQFIVEIFQNLLLVVAFDRKRLAENSFESTILSFRWRNVFLQKTIITFSLYCYQVRNLNGILYFSKITNTLFSTNFTHYLFSSIKCPNRLTSTILCVIIAFFTKGLAKLPLLPKPTQLRLRRLQAAFVQLRLHLY